MPLAAPLASEELAGRLGTRPLPPELLEQALTHASVLNESDTRTASNERLEFLGDAVLGMIIASDLYRLYPNAGEGELTRLRADIVRGSTLARAAMRLGLGDHIILGRGEEAAGGRARDRNLAGAFEALIGAVYLSQGYRQVRSLIHRLLGPEIQQVRREGARFDAKSALQHLVQARWHQPPGYTTVELGPDDEPRRFTVEVRAAGVTLGTGTGARKSEAQQEAARRALVRLAEEGEAES